MLTENSLELNRKPRILVVDDSRVMRKAISRILNPQFDLIETEDGEAGWEALLGDEAIDVIITDVEMPRLDGHALLTRIRSSEIMRIREMPVIVITGAEDEPAKQRAYACGATDFVIKPIDGVQLLACTRAQLKPDQIPGKPAETTAALAGEEANRDPLTQLYNRRFFMQRGEQDIAFAKRHNSPLSLVKLDIDNLKTIFDKYGDHAADNILVKLAQILLAKMRQEDTVGRLGGTEFAVLLPSAQHVEAAALAERLSAAVRAEIFEHEGVRIPITISIGVVTWDDYSIDTIDKFLAQAEKHLRLAKGAGGNRLHTSAAKEPAKSNQPDATGDTGSRAVNGEKPIPAPVSASAPTIDTALHMLADGDIAALEPHLPVLTLRILPLLDLCNKKLGLGLSFAIESLKEKLADYTEYPRPSASYLVIPPLSR